MAISLDLSQTEGVSSQDIDFQCLNQASLWWTRMTWSLYRTGFLWALFLCERTVKFNSTIAFWAVPMWKKGLQGQKINKTNLLSINFLSEAAGESSLQIKETHTGHKIQGRHGHSFPNGGDLCPDIPFLIKGKTPELFRNTMPITQCLLCN